MHILLTNDDGISAPGLLALAKEMQALGNVTVFAPDHNWSASGHVKTLHRPLRVSEYPLFDGIRALTTDGAPSDCVALAVLGLVKEKIDVVVSGINSNANLGHDVTYSGTVTAAMEAAIWHLPGVAVSVESSQQNGILDYTTAAQVAREVVATAMENGFPPNTLLNVNVPYLPYKELKGFMVTRQGLRVYLDRLVTREDPRGRPYYWIGGDAPTGVPDEGTDFGALEDGYVSITPLGLDLTAYDVMETLQQWKWA